MNLIPEFLQPFGPIMASLIVCWLFAFSLTLHRLTGYVQRRHVLRGRWHQVALKISNLKDGVVQQDTLFVQTLCETIRRDPSDAGLKRFFHGMIRPQRQADFWNERGLSVLGSVAPLLGLAGTCWGILLTFDSFAGQAAVVTLKDLAGPFSIALRTTLFGVGCAALCLPVRSLIPLFELHRQEDVELESSWRQLRKLLRTERKPKPRKPRHVAPHAPHNGKPNPNEKRQQQVTQRDEAAHDLVFAAVAGREQPVAQASNDSKRTSQSGDDIHELPFV